MPGFPITYSAIKEMVEKKAKSVPLARKIVRRAGLRSGTSSETQSAGGALLLSLPPAIPVGPCPKGPFSDGLFETHEDRLAFYEDAAGADTQEERDIFRDEWIIGYLGMEDEIVATYIMDFITYDYADETATIVLLTSNGCSVEIDVGRDPASFWEQHKDGDTRFTDKNVPIGEDQDFRFLVRSIHLATTEAFETFSRHSTPEEEDPWDYETRGVVFDTPPVEQAVEVYRKTYTPEEATGGNMPWIWLTSQKLLDNVIFPRFVSPEDPGIDTNFGGMASDLAETGVPMLGQLATYNNAFAGFHYVDEAYGTFASPPVADFEQEYFPIIQSGQAYPSETPIDGTTTHGDQRVYKEAPSGEQTIDWSEDPAPLETFKDRYDASWPTFRITEVRVIGGGVSQPV